MKKTWLAAAAASAILTAVACESRGPSSAPTGEAQADRGDAFTEPPEWAGEAIWYQVFVERFYNGDPTNDPTPADIAGAYPWVVPESWAVTSWTQDWYLADPYFAELDGFRDDFGNEIVGFDAKVNLRRYGGDLQGVIEKLDYIEALGVNAIYFNPLNDSPSYAKYDARNWRHIDRNFGPTPADDAEIMAREDPADPDTWEMTGADRLFVELLGKLHERGIRVILDYSWNHTGHTFWAWKDVVMNQVGSDYADWYWIESFDDPATEQNELTYRSWFGAPDLPYVRETAWVDPTRRVQPFEGDIYSDAAKQHIFAVTRKWLDPNGDGDPSDGVDGFRLDVAAEMPLGFWREYRRLVRGINPSACLVGEVWWERFPDDLLDPEPFLRGDVFDGVMNYRWYRAARQFFAKAPSPMSPSEFVEHLESLTANLRPVSGQAMMNVAASHDTPRLSTSLFNKGKYKFEAKASQNPEYRVHRPDAETSAVQRLLLAHQFTYTGAPHIWSGDEMGMWGSDDPHTRKPLMWPELQFDDEVGHPLGDVRPPDRVAFDEDLNGYYRKLIEIRRSNPVLSHGELEFLLADDDRDLLAYSRYDGGAEVIAVFNMSADEHALFVPAKTSRDYVDVLAGGAVARDERSLRLTLPGRTAVVLVAR